MGKFHVLNPKFNQWNKELIDCGRNNLTVKNHCSFTATVEKLRERSMEFNLESWKD